MPATDLYYGAEIAIDKESALDDSGAITAMVAGFGNQDAVGDTILDKAFDTFLARNKSPVPMLLSHKSEFLVGEWTRFEKEERGLVGEGQIDRDLNIGDDAYTNVKKGRLHSTSVGLIVPGLRGMKRTGPNAYEISRADIKEVSLTFRPANKRAKIRSVKEDGERINRDELTEHLMEFGLAKSDVRRLYDGGFAYMVKARDALDTKDADVSRDAKVANDLDALLKRIAT